MSNIRVAVVTKFPYTEADGFSGLFKVSKNLCDALAERPDIDLCVISGTNQVNQVEHKTFKGYSAIFFPYHSDVRYYGTFYMQAALAVKKHLLQLKPDIVHCQAVAETPVGGLLSKLPLVATIHGIAAAELATARSLKIKLAYRVQSMVEAWYVKRLPHVIACSPYVKRFVHHHNPSAQLYDISNPMDPHFFEIDPHHTRPDPQSILLIGAVSYRKGHDIMIEAMQKLTKKYPKAYLTVIGKEVDTAFAGQIKQKIKQYNLSENVNWLGAVSQERLLAEMKTHQIVCLPSREDTLPMVLSQAMIVGNICVASDAGGIPDMIQSGENGFLFARENPEALYQTLSGVIDMPVARLNTIRFHNRLFAEKTYQAKSVAEQTVQVYKTILSGFG